MDTINGTFIKTWRDRYRWLSPTRKESEEKIIYLENLVINNVIREGTYSFKGVFLEVVDWKTQGRSVWRFSKNSEDEVSSAVVEVYKHISENPNNVSFCIDAFCRLCGVGIPVASAMLRFLDPVEHKYGIIDGNVAQFLNSRGITNFDLRREDDWIKKYPRNSYHRHINEYQRYHNWLQQEVKKFNKQGITYKDIYGDEKKSPL